MRPKKLYLVMHVGNITYHIAPRRPTMSDLSRTEITRIKGDSSAVLPITTSCDFTDVDSLVDILHAYEAGRRAV